MCHSETLYPLACTRPSSDEFCYPIWKSLSKISRVPIVSLWLLTSISVCQLWCKSIFLWLYKARDAQRFQEFDTNLHCINNILSLFFQLMLEEHFRHSNKLTMNMSRYIIWEITAFVNESLFHQWYANMVASYNRSKLQYRFSGLID